MLEPEKQLCECIEKLCDEVTIGTEQLIGEIANKSEMRQYKIQQRVGK